MRVGRASKCGRARMTRLAREVRGNMAARLAERGNAIMTSGTSGGYPGMVHLRPDSETRRARVAHLARRDGEDVVRRLRDGDLTVVAVRA